jgi:hypothetical protein
MNGFSLLLLDILLSQAFLALPETISAILAQVPGPLPPRRAARDAGTRPPPGGR